MSSMAFPTPVCVKCKAIECMYWHRGEDGSPICNECFDGVHLASTSKEDQEKTKSEETGPKITTRRSTRAAATPKPRTTQPVQKKGKGRRVIFKKTCMKAPRAVATTITSESVVFKEHLYKIGDIVSVRDVEGKKYYCQLHGFLTDQYCEKSAVIRWLLPSDRSPDPDEAFDPATYMLGFEEDIPRKMEIFEFVMHAPSDYYKSRRTPYPPKYNTETRFTQLIASSNKKWE